MEVDIPRISYRIWLCEPKMHINVLWYNLVSIIAIFWSVQKPHGVPGFIKHYHMLLNPKQVHEVCKIRQIPSACISCTTMLDKTWAPDIEPKQQP